MTQQAYPLAWPPGFPRAKEREKQLQAEENQDD